MTFTDLFTDALSRIRIARAGDVLSPEDADYCLLLFNGLLDQWNADGRAVYASIFTDYTLTPSLNPHTIGPGGTFVVTQRPVEIQAAALSLGGNPVVYTPIEVRGKAWYQAQTVPGLSTSIPTDVYFEESWPLGKLYFYPLPSAASGIRLWTRVLLAAVAAADVGNAFSMPPGYGEALTLTLAKKAAPGFGQPWTASLETERREAVALIFDDNERIPDLVTRDAGMPGGGGGGFNFLTGETR